MLPTAALNARERQNLQNVPLTKSTHFSYSCKYDHNKVIFSSL